MLNSPSLRVLVVEDNPLDAELIVDALREAGFKPDWERVETPMEYSAHLDPTLDLILSDHNLPQFNAFDALHIVQQRGLDIPFIIISGSMGEDLAVMAIKQGAADYLLKDRLARLGSAVEHALKAKKLRDEQQIAEAAMRASEERYRLMAENATDMISKMTPEGIYLYVSPACRNLFGFEPEEMLGRSCEGFIHPDAIQMVREARLSLTRHLETLTLAFQICRKNGDYVWIETTNRAVCDESGVIKEIITVSRDITERTRAQEALERERNLLRTLIDNVPDHIFVKDGKGYFTVSNAAHANSLSLTPADIVGKTALDLYSAELGAQYHADDLSVVSSGEAQISAENKAFGEQANEQWSLTTKVPFRDIDGQVIGLVGISRDITARKQMEQSLYQAQIAEHEHRIFAEALHEITLARINNTDHEVVLKRILDNVGRVVPHDGSNIMLIQGDTLHTVQASGNLSAQRAFRVRPLSPSEIPAFSRILTTGKPCLIPDTLLDPDWVDLRGDDRVRSYVGTPIHMHGQIIGFLNLDSATPGFFTSTHAERLQAFADEAAIAIENAALYDQLKRHAVDLEEQVERRTLELRTAKEHVEAILNNSSDAIVVTNIHGIIQQINPAFTHMFSYPVDAVLGKSIATLAHEQSAANLLNVLRSVVERDQSHRVEIVARRQNDSVFDADVALAPILERGKHATNLVCSLRDVSKHKELETELRQTVERERELSELKSRFVSVASHEFRTPLATILATTDTLSAYRQRMDDAQIDARLGKIRQQILHMKDIMDDVLQLAKMQAGHAAFAPVESDLDALCQDILDEFQNRPDPTHHLNYVCSDQPVIAKFDPRLMRQVINNLVSNAMKYSPDGKQVLIALTSFEREVVLRIQDEGIGIPSSDLKHLFEPFHRAKNVGAIAGTGLGLSITKQAIDLHGGTIQVETEVGKGSTFIVTIPLGNVRLPEMASPSSNRG